MKTNIDLTKLLKAFPGSFINDNLEVIFHREANEYFGLKNCESELDVKCKVLEWLSRGCYKTEPYRRKSKNDDFHRFMSEGVNRYLETDFSTDDFEIIYQELGNCINREKTIRFIQSDYDMKILEES